MTPVSNATIIMMGAATILCVAIPIVALIIFKSRTQMKMMPVLVGAVTFFMFALVLEPLCHQFFLNPARATGQVILSNPLLYAVYGGLAAGIFEETGRLIAFKFLFKSWETRESAIMYGIGHGGIEMIMIGAFNIGSTLIIALGLNAIGMDGYLTQGAASGIDVATLEATLTSITSAPPYVYLLSLLERVAAFILQISLSVLVFKAISQKKWLYFPLAIVLHMLIDAVAGFYQMGVINLITCEAIVLIYSILVAIFAFRQYKAMESGCDF